MGKKLTWQTDFQGLECKDAICGKTEMDENTCRFCLNAKKTSGKIGRIK